jgi:hypothetical protein
MYVRVSLCLCCPVFRQRPCNELITRPRSPTACERSALSFNMGARSRVSGQENKKVTSPFLIKHHAIMAYGRRGTAPPFLTSSLNADEQPASTAGKYTPVPTEQKAGRAPDPFWTLISPRLWNPGRPVRRYTYWAITAPFKGNGPAFLWWNRTILCPRAKIRNWPYQIWNKSSEVLAI